MEKITIDKAFEQYTTKELIEFHANISAIYIGVSDWDKSPILMLAMHAMTELETRKDAAIYLAVFKEKVFGITA